MHILFLTHYYPPESNAPANRVSELALTWIAEGHEVTVVTCTPNHPKGQIYPGYRNRLIQRENLDGVEVIRLLTILAPNVGVGRRLLNYLFFMIAAILASPWLPVPDVVVTTSPQFFAGLSGAAVSRIKRRPWVLEIRDIWPESVSAVGAMRKGPALRAVEALERWAYRTADQVVAVSHAFIPHISERGPLKRPVEVVENGVNLDLFPGVSAEPSCRENLGLTGKVVFGYVGTHGMAHGLETVLRAAGLTRGNPEIRWLLIGAGAERSRLLALRDELALDNVVMLDQRPREEMPAIWSSIDVSLVVLRDSPLFRQVIPSKMFEAMAMSCPILLGVDGEARRIVEAGACGLYVAPENAPELALAAEKLAADAKLRRSLGENGVAFVRREYDRRYLARRYLAILESVVSPKSTERR